MQPGKVHEYPCGELPQSDLQHPVSEHESITVSDLTRMGSLEQPDSPILPNEGDGRVAGVDAWFDPCAEAWSEFIERLLF